MNMEKKSVSPRLNISLTVKCPVGLTDWALPTKNYREGYAFPAAFVPMKATVFPDATAVVTLGVDDDGRIWLKGWMSLDGKKNLVMKRGWDIASYEIYFREDGLAMVEDPTPQKREQSRALRGPFPDLSRWMTKMWFRHIKVVVESRRKPRLRLVS